MAGQTATSGRPSLAAKGPAPDSPHGQPLKDPAEFRGRQAGKRVLTFCLLSNKNARPLAASSGHTTFQPNRTFDVLTTSLNNPIDKGQTQRYKVEAHI